MGNNWLSIDWAAVAAIIAGIGVLITFALTIKLIILTKNIAIEQQKLQKRDFKLRLYEKRYELFKSYDTTLNLVLEVLQWLSYTFEKYPFAEYNKISDKVEELIILDYEEIKKGWDRYKKMPEILISDQKLLMHFRIFSISVTSVKYLLEFFISNKRYEDFTEETFNIRKEKLFKEKQYFDETDKNKYFEEKRKEYLDISNLDE